MTSTIVRAATGVLLVGCGVTAGWWLRGLDQPNQRDQPVVAAAPTPAQGNALPPAPVLASSAPPRQQAVPAPSTSAPSTSAPSPQGHNDADDVQRFRQLLESGAFAAAMNLFAEVYRRDLAQATELKAIVMAQLETFLDQRNAPALSGLVDAFLSRFYDDLDVLLLLARHQLQSDYLAEAAHTFQLAYTYAYTGEAQQQVQRAFAQFVQDVDQLLSRQTRWRDLLEFYETLELLDLTQPELQLRQAELYLARGEPEYGRALLRRLTAQPAVAARAQALLDGAQPAAQPQQPAAKDAIALRMHGSHYHLPLRLNDRENVQLIIDTGATTTTLARRSFERLTDTRGVTELGPQVFNTANGVAQGTMYRVDSVQLGGQRLSDVHIAVLDFDAPSEIDGLLGMNILRNFRFQVDQDEQTLYLQPRRK